ncbi:hypothetical protein DES49_2693 [Halospina denitrificans]|uniref:Uncharacterized protein n=1 Tax=Halospina denitrificans TaxID=332522 RepID=A0A4R7JL31_9GAMM|nr:hypothetical protein [Halospina denitrificans]TDT37733.1 hypothetical protein DES49_2693 [Halospina denitrificans]
MINMPLHILFALIGLGAIASSMLGALLLRLTLTRRLKKKLKATGDYWHSGTIDFDFINTIIFAWACATTWVQRLKRFQLLYPGLDVRSFAKWYEKVAAYGAIYGLMVAFLIAPFFYLFEP